MSVDHLVVGITGASGAPYARHLLREVDDHVDQLDVVISRHSIYTINEELDCKVSPTRFTAEELAGRTLEGPDQINEYPPEAIDAPVASGTRRPDAMAIVPCSMGTLGRVANGISNNLITRAADVCLKESIPLVMVLREMPYNGLHIDHMQILHREGATIMSAAPYFYSGATTGEELILTVVAKIMDQLSMDHDLPVRWESSRE